MTTHTPVTALIIHGVGCQTPDFANTMMTELTNRFTREIQYLPDPPSQPKQQLIFRPVHWAPVMQDIQHELWARLSAEHNLNYTKLRKYIINFAGDAIAYQITPHDRTVYDAVHQRITDELNTLAQTPGVSETSPLAIIGHSLGTVIASNYFWDLQHGTHTSTTQTQTDTPLARGETLARLFTLGSPLAVWAVRYRQPDFGTPIAVPSPKLRDHYPVNQFPNLTGEWLNFYDKDDVIAFPLKPLNAEYAKMVTEDVPINVGGLFSSWNPLSHNDYWTDNDVTVPMARSLVNLWKSINVPSPSQPHSTEL